MNWFRFQIPQNKDGSRVSYSPNWFGTMPKCPKDVTVLLYNDKEGYGVAQTEDGFVPKEVTKLTEMEAKDLISVSIDTLIAGKGDGVFLSKSLIPEGYDLVKNSIEARWLPKAIVGDKPEAVLVDYPIESGMMNVGTKKAVFCPICHQFIMWLPDNLIAKSIQLTCPMGHEVVLSG